MRKKKLEIEQRVRKSIFKNPDNGPPDALTGLRESSSDSVYRRTPYFYQTYMDTCMDTCVNMMLAYYGKPHQAFLPTHPRPSWGLSGMNYFEAYKQLEHPFTSSDRRMPICISPRTWTSQELAAELAEGPLIAPITNELGFGHAILVIGVDGKDVCIHDPAKGGNKTITMEKFNKYLKEQELIGMDSEVGKLLHGEKDWQSEKKYLE